MGHFGVVLLGCGDVAEGERFYGYFPLSTHLVVRPARVDAGGFVDATPHRAELPAIYNRYRRAGSEPAYTADTEPEQVILRPLFGTSFLLADFLIEQGFHGAEPLVSAVEQDRWGMAFSSRRATETETAVGLTRRTASTRWPQGLYDSGGGYRDIGLAESRRPLRRLLGQLRVARATTTPRHNARQRTRRPRTETSWGRGATPAAPADLFARFLEQRPPRRNPTVEDRLASVGARSEAVRDRRGWCDPAWPRPRRFAGYEGGPGRVGQKW